MDGWLRACTPQTCAKRQNQEQLSDRVIVIITGRLSRKYLSQTRWLHGGLGKPGHLQGLYVPQAIGLPSHQLEPAHNKLPATQAKYHSNQPAHAGTLAVHWCSCRTMTSATLLAATIATCAQCWLVCMCFTCVLRETSTVQKPELCCKGISVLQEHFHGIAHSLRNSINAELQSTCSGSEGAFGRSAN